MFPSVHLTFRFNLSLIDLVERFLYVCSLRWRRRWISFTEGFSLSSNNIKSDAALAATLNVLFENKSLLDFCSLSQQSLN